MTTDWQPGDPLYPAHSSGGAGGHASPFMTAECGEDPAA